MSITIVLVIYKERLEHSSSFQSVIANSQLLASQDVNLVIYDNSPEAQPLPPSAQEFAIHYHHDPRNPGLAAAYNYALQRARDEDQEWLLLLDQDTHLTSEYFREMVELPGALTADCVCIAPLVSDGREQISPMDNTRVRFTAEGIQSGYRDRHITAINSGACWRIEWLNAIGGFNADFPLDYLDHWACHRALSDGKRFYVMSSQLRQSLSISDHNQVSEARYCSIYESEYRFYRHHRRDLFPNYKRRLPLRLLKQLLLFKNKRIARKTLELILRSRSNA